MNQSAPTNADLQDRSVPSAASDDVRSGDFAALHNSNRRAARVDSSHNAYGYDVVSSPAPIDYVSSGANVSHKMESFKIIPVHKSEAKIMDDMSVPIALGIEVDINACNVRVPQSSGIGIIDLLSETLFCAAGDHTQVLPRSLVNLLVKIATAFDHLPSALFLHDLSEIGYEHVAWGGYADIYQGNYQGKKVALKRFREYRQKQRKEYLRRKFSKEVILWRFLDHPNILEFLGLYEGATASGCHISMVSPWLQSGNMLEFAVNKNPPITIAEVNRLLFQAANGLSYLHQLGIVHGDIRCANILIDDEGRARVTDFGLSSLIASEASVSATVSQGCARWNAPELFDPSPIRTVKSDVYAFACTCLELHTRMHPFPNIKHANGVMHNIISGKRPERPSIGHPYADSNDILWKMAERCWARSADERPPIRAVKWELACLPGLEVYRRVLKIAKAMTETTS